MKPTYYKGITNNECNISLWDKPEDVIMEVLDEDIVLEEGTNIEVFGIDEETGRVIIYVPALGEAAVIHGSNIDKIEE
jgi:hypothetical protein